MSNPLTDDELISLANTWGTKDGELARADAKGMDGEMIADFAMDAWMMFGWMNFETHPDLKNAPEFLRGKAKALKLSSVYETAFINAVKGKA